MNAALIRGRAALHALASDRSGVALIEFALVTPLLLVLGLGGMELANLAIVKMRLSQAAGGIADNASRIGDSDLLASPRIYERDINDLFIGLDIQAGRYINLFQHGRVVLSSLERNASDGQWIRWQRCKGRKPFESAYGLEGTGAIGTAFPGMGSARTQVRAPATSAVMFVEIAYDYQPLIGGAFVTWLGSARELRTEAVFLVRGSRDIGGLYQHTPPAPVARCDVYSES